MTETTTDPDPDTITDPDPDPDPDAGAWPLYASTRDRFITLARSLDPEQAGQAVPLTPGWTIAEVLAHLCGLNADVAIGMRQGLGTDERTAHQVSARAGHTVEQTCQEWLGLASAMEAAIVEDGFFGRRLAADLVIHLHDVQHGLGLAIDQDDEATVSGGRTYAARTPDRWAEATGVAAVIELVDRDGDIRFEPTAAAVADADPLILRATPYDFLRSISGRRSRAQVVALDWQGDPTPLLDHFSPYGPLRPADAEV